MYGTRERGEWVKTRVEAENTSILSQVSRCSFCIDTMKCMLFSDIVEEKVGPEKYSNFSVLILECLNRVYLLI